MNRPQDIALETLGRPARWRRWGWDAVGIASVLVFAATFFVLLRGQSELRHEDALILDPTAEIQTGDEWMGLYLGSTKVGLLHTRKERRQDGGFRFEVVTRMRLTAMRTQADLEINVFAHLAPDLALESFRFSMATGPSQLRGDGVVRGKRIDLSLNSGGERSTHSVVLDQPPVLRSNLGPVLSRRDLAPGTWFSFETFDPLTQSNQTIKIEVVGPDSVVIMGEEVAATHIRQHVSGLVLDAWINARGEWLRQNLSMGLVAIREPEEEARWGLAKRSAESAHEGGGVDLTANVMIAVDGLPESLEGARQLKLRMSGVTLDQFELDDPRRQQRSHETLVIELERLGEGVAIPVSDPRFATDLAAEPLVQSDSERILHAARRAAGDAADTIDAARRLVAWIRGKIRQQNVFGVPSALETLSTGVGDCNEHSALFAAMARSIGVPTRIVVGLAYQRGQFGYHAWNEIWTRDGWLSVDATWDQIPADVGHVRFVTGGLSKQIEMLSVMGRLRIDGASLVR